MHASEEPQADRWRERLHDLRTEPAQADALWSALERRLPQPLPRQAAPIRRWYYAAAAAAVGLAIGLLLWYPAPPAETHAPLAQTPISAPPAEMPIPLLMPPTPESIAELPAPEPAPLAEAATVGEAPAAAQPVANVPVPPPQGPARRTVAAHRPAVEAAAVGPLQLYEQGVQAFASENYCQSHYHLNQARKHLCAREPLDLEINRLMTLIEHRVSSECICLAYEEAGH